MNIIFNFKCIKTRTPLHVLYLFTFLHPNHDLVNSNLNFSSDTFYYFFTGHGLLKVNVKYYFKLIKIFFVQSKFTSIWIGTLGISRWVVPHFHFFLIFIEKSIASWDTTHSVRPLILWNIMFSIIKNIAYHKNPQQFKMHK